MNLQYPSLILSAIVILTYSCSPTPEVNYSEQEKKEYPTDWFYQQRAYPFDHINKKVYLEALQQRMAQSQIKNTNDPQWAFAGPTNIGGRITDVEMHSSSLDIIYAGTASGGIFKSVDRGENWFPIFDEAMTLSIGDLCIAPSDSSILYVGTGEANAGGGSIAYDGYGIYRTNDGGNNWVHLGLENTGSVGSILVHPEDPEKVWVTAMGSLFSNNSERGVFRTTDGGQSWEQILSVSDSTGAIDLALHPTDPDILYATMWERVRRVNHRQYGGPTSGIYRSEDGGDSWLELTNGLPAEDNGRIGVAVTPASPESVYAIYADSIGFHKDIFRSDDRGDSWYTINSDSLSTYSVSYAWWFGDLFVHPDDAETIFAFGLFTYRTKNGGANWENINNNDSVFVHVDPHSLYIHPQDPEFIVLGNDGGVYISENGGDTWDHKNSLPITQFYSCEIDLSNPERLYGGAQDNGTIRTLTGSVDDWVQILGGDGLIVKVQPDDPYYIFAEVQNGFLFRSTNGGTIFFYTLGGINLFLERSNWKAPYLFDPINPQQLYYGTNRLFRSVNSGGFWVPISPDLAGNPPQQNITFGTLTAIAVSPAAENIIYVGTDNGMVWNTTTGGGTAADWNLLSQDLPNRWVTAVATDPIDPLTAYVTFSGYRESDYLPHIFRTIDGGSSWEDISSGLPEVPVNDIVVDPENPDWLYIATDIGVYYSMTAGNNWEVLGTGLLPNLVISDLSLHNPTRKLLAATYGRSMYRISLEEVVSVERETLSFDGMKIFPNPAEDYTNVSFEWKGNNTSLGIYLFDSNGRLLKTVFQGSLLNGAQQFSVDLDDFPSGYYVCQIKAEKEEINKPIIKK